MLAVAVHARMADLVVKVQMGRLSSVSAAQAIEAINAKQSPIHVVRIHVYMMVYALASSQDISAVALMVAMAGIASVPLLVLRSYHT